MDYKKLTKIVDAEDPMAKAYKWAKMWCIDMNRDGVSMSPGTACEKLMKASMSLDDDTLDALAFVLKFYIEEIQSIYD